MPKILKKQLIKQNIMKNSLFEVLKFILIIIVLTSCESRSKNDKTKNCEDNFPNIEKWMLIDQEESLSNFGPFAKSGYINEKGDTMIPLDKYMCLSDTFEYYGVVFDFKNEKLVGINKNEKILFEAVWNSEGSFIPESEGRIMIVKDKKYGFANHKGEIIIKPKYECVESFFKGKARVSNECRKSKDEHHLWESENWIYIDKCGKEVASNK